MLIGRDGGRGGEGDVGRGGGGKINAHMGELPAISSLLTSTSSPDILRILNPPSADRAQRQALIAQYAMPPHEEWRLSHRAGKPLTGQIIRSNHFLINPACLPSALHHYHVHLYKCEKDGSRSYTDFAAELDCSVTFSLLFNLAKTQGWKNCAYDGRSAFYSVKKLPIPDDGLCVDVHPSDTNGEPTKIRIHVKITYIQSILTNVGDISLQTLAGLKAAVLMPMRWMQVTSSEPAWHLLGTKAYRANQPPHPLTSNYVALRGYYAGLKSCMAGLALVVDMSVSCFLAGGSMIDAMWQGGGFNSYQDMIQSACISWMGDGSPMHDRRY